jgi:hypothetical protein
MAATADRPAGHDVIVHINLPADAATVRQEGPELRDAIAGVAAALKQALPVVQGRAVPGCTRPAGMRVRLAVVGHSNSVVAARTASFQVVTIREEPQEILARKWLREPHDRHRMLQDAEGWVDHLQHCASVATSTIDTTERPFLPAGVGRVTVASHTAQRAQCATLEGMMESLALGIKNMRQALAEEVHTGVCAMVTAHNTQRMQLGLMHDVVRFDTTDDKGFMPAAAVPASPFGAAVSGWWSGPLSPHVIVPNGHGAVREECAGHLALPRHCFRTVALANKTKATGMIPTPQDLMEVPVSPAQVQLQTWDAQYRHMDACVEQACPPWQVYEIPVRTVGDVDALEEAMLMFTSKPCPVPPNSSQPHAGWEGVVRSWATRDAEMHIHAASIVPSVEHTREVYIHLLPLDTQVLQPCVQALQDDIHVKAVVGASVAVAPFQVDEHAVTLSLALTGADPVQCGTDTTSLLATILSASKV